MVLKSGAQRTFGLSKCTPLGYNCSGQINDLNLKPKAVILKLSNDLQNGMIKH